MKKLILALALIGGGVVGESVVYADTPVVCSPDNPCVYIGKAIRRGGGGSVNIKVYLKKLGDNYTYVVDVENGQATVYAIDDENVHNKYHFTYNNNVYEFSL